MFFSDIVNSAQFQIHFIGVGGIGMSGIAEILNDLGFKVSGSDLALNANVQRLQQKNVFFFQGHARENVQNANFVVISSAIDENNVELQEARSRGIPILKRAEMLAELMRFKFSIAISGSHGKTTTTSLTSVLFKNLGYEPTIISGGIINQIGSNASLGKDGFIIAEADESDATFIRIPANVAVLTNLDPEHLSYYGTYEKLREAFVQFIENLPFYGFAVLCSDRPELMEIKAEIRDRKILTYGLHDENADVYASNVRQNFADDENSLLFDLHFKGQKFSDVNLPMVGMHNLSNALAALTVAIGLDLNLEGLPNAFAGFSGVKRRFTKIAEIKGVNFIDDYAHHPAEISATIRAAKEILNSRGKGKLITIFEPHRYSRLQDLFGDFAKSFEMANCVAITEIYAAGEKPIEGCSKESLAAAISQTNEGIAAKTVAGKEDMISFIKKNAQEGDFVVFMGAGAISKVAYEICEELELYEFS